MTCSSRVEILRLFLIDVLDIREASGRMFCAASTATDRDGTGGSGFGICRQKIARNSNEFRADALEPKCATAPISSMNAAQVVKIVAAVRVPENSSRLSSSAGNATGREIGMRQLLLRQKEAPTAFGQYITGPGKAKELRHI
jgi:hypothetical protein